jgi:hypothetical protein
LKAILATLGIAAVVLTSTITPASADTPVIVAAVEAVTETVTAPDTVLVSESPEITTVAASAIAPVVYAEPVAVSETVTEPATVVTSEPTVSEPVPAPVEPTVTCEEQGKVTAEDGSCVNTNFHADFDPNYVSPYAPKGIPATAPTESETVVAAATAEPESYPAPSAEPNTPACIEDEPCWQCDTMGNGICGNPVCLAANLFTIDDSGTCGAVPAGLTPEELRADALYEFNSRNTVYEEWLLAAFEKTYIGFGSTLQPTHIIRSSTYPGVVHYFH